MQLQNKINFVILQVNSSLYNLVIGTWLRNCLFLRCPLLTDMLAVHTMGLSTTYNLYRSTLALNIWRAPTNKDAVGNSNCVRPVTIGQIQYGDIGNKGHNVTRYRYALRHIYPILPSAKKNVLLQLISNKLEKLSRRILLIAKYYCNKLQRKKNKTKQIIYGRSHLSGDLKWRQAEMRDIIIFP